MKHADSPMTPSFEMPSPLLRTQLKAMTPHTPLSNRLVGANLDIGSTKQESKLQDYDESFEAGEPAPEFQLSLFPSAFQVGFISSSCAFIAHANGETRLVLCSGGSAQSKCQLYTASSRVSELMTNQHWCVCTQLCCSTK
jgi:hypothetical protein